MRFAVRLDPGCFVYKLERITVEFKSSRTNDELDAPNSEGVIKFRTKFRCYREIAFGRLMIS